MKYAIPSLLYLLCLVSSVSSAQALRIPNPVNITSMTGRQLGSTDIEIRYNAPSVRGREGSIYGTNVVPYGYTVLGFGSDMASPWRAGADESTVISFSTDVMINGKKLQAGSYGFFIAVNPDSCTLIFNSNLDGWGSYFYNKDLDVLHVSTLPEKGVEPMRELLAYTFSNQTDSTVEVAMEWEHWRIPFTVSVNLKETILADIRAQLSGALGFDPPSLQAGAQWCLQNDINLEQALHWMQSVTSPVLGGVKTFRALTLQADLYEKTGQNALATELRSEAMDMATVLDLHQYGRQLLLENKPREAYHVFEMNHKKNKGIWPTNVGMARAESAMKHYSKALQYAKKALDQAPDDANRRSLEMMIKNLEAGKDIN